MHTLEPQTRFLIRGSALLIASLSLWWFVLLAPSLYLLRNAAAIFIPVEENPAGDWTLRVAIDSQTVHSIDFDISRSDATTFTFSLPVFWAIIAAAPGFRRNLKPLLVGTPLMAAIELALLLAFAKITASSAAAQFTGGESSGHKWIHTFGVYLVVNVLPYALPFVVALSLDRQLRHDVLALANPEPVT
jgi:hypothetical protein